ncbi:carboxyl transferase domain-containing protein [Sedimentitalea sp. JM2-8]|uniref:Carboxyl transferase domain-containing protein n=1 Tax=Sedimentitalea xiamensis TaxID=3050037 RepID=A0ABT7F9N8_9RHOB|nr:carboxyl transferase domain-containing protein [Sedimentitalea xiamensis]MDK3071824.1 carboxyl transferase domain-containing protein [Sedimentitalea xiamensis]
MPAIESRIDVRSPEFGANAEAMQAHIDAFRAIETKVIEAAEAARARYEKRGNIMPQDRLNLLLDQGSPFLELSSLAGYMMFDDRDGTGAGAGCIAGIGTVSGVRVLIVVDNFAVKGGTISPIGLKKKLRLQDIALENKLPLVTLAQSGGANLAYAAELFVTGGRAFANQARMSAAGVPQITVVHGSATAGGAYQPGLSDYIVMVKRQATTYLAGPPLLKAATGEIATDEELGGAEMHTRVSGVGDYLAQNDADGIRIAREIMAQLPWNDIRPAGRDFAEPLFSPEELIGVVPADPKMPYDCREIIARIADGSEFLDFKPEYDTQTVCGHIQIEGHPVGVIGNNGPITAAGAAKGGQFIQLCEQAGIPILFLHNITGFLVGTDPEQNGIIKHGSKMIQAVANAKVPKISINVGGSYGAGNYAMCGRGFDPRFLFSWPQSRTAVMGGAQAGMVLRIVTGAKMAKAGTIDEDKLATLERKTQEQMDSQTTAIASTARVEDDGLIDPRDTRRVLAYVLDICREADRRDLRSNTFGIARF